MILGIGNDIIEVERVERPAVIRILCRDVFQRRR